MADQEVDPYYQLRPEAVTPEGEICSCGQSRILLLRGGLISNPLACAVCNLEVRPEDVGFDQPLAQELAFWLSFHECFYLLWLDSQEFEEWAFEQLSDPGSPVNSRGMAALKSLSKVSPAYYWWFQDTGRESYMPLSACPLCSQDLSPVGWALGCKSCKVFVANDGE